MRGVAASFISVLLAVGVAGCDRAGDDSGATLRVQVPGSAVASLQRAALSMTGVPSSINRIDISVTADGRVVAGGDILGGGGELELTVPAAIALTVEGAAFQGDRLLFKGSNAVPPIRVGRSATVGLILNAVEGDAPPIVITARTQLDTNAQGESANGESSNVIFSANHRYVLFRSLASNLVTGDTNGSEDLFQKDLATNAVGAITASRNGKTFGFGGSGERPYGMSADGRFVVFAQVGSSVDPADVNGTVDVFIKDTREIKFTRLFEGPPFTNVVGNFPEALVVSNNAQRVAFEAFAPPQGQTGTGTYVHDATGGLRYVGDGTAPSLSGDGRTLAYWLFNSSYNAYVLYVEDVDLLFSSGADPAQLPLLTDTPAAVGLSADGSRVSLTGRSIANPTGEDQPILFERGTQDFTVLSAASNGAPLPSSSIEVTNPSLSISGNVASFTFGASNTVYVKNTDDGQLVAVANDAFDAVISPDSALVSYSSDDHLFVDNNPLVNPVPVSTAPDIKTVTLNNQVTLTWEPVVGATSYDVYAATDPGVNASNYQQLGGVRFENVSSPFTVSAAQLPSSGTYFFVVVPVNASGSGPVSSGVSASFQATTAPKSYAFYMISGSGGVGLGAINPDSPASPTVFEPVGSVRSATTAPFTAASYDAQSKTLSGPYTHAYVYGKTDGKLYKVSGLVDNGPPSPVQVSTEANACDEVFTYESDFANPENSQYVFRSAGSDQVCFSGDDEYRMVRVGMNASATPIPAGFPVAAFHDWSTGAISSWLVDNSAGNTLLRCDADFAGCTFIAEYALGSNSIAELSGNRVLLQIDDELLVFNGSTGSLSQAIYTRGAGEFFNMAQGDGSRVFFNIYSSQNGTRLMVAPADGSSAAAEITTVAASAFYFWVTTNKIVFSDFVSGDVFSVAKLPSSVPDPLISPSNSGESINIYFPPSGNRVFYTRVNDSGVPSAGMIKDDGSEGSEVVGSEWVGLASANTENVETSSLSDYYNRYFMVDGYSQTMEFGNATLRSIDAATGTEVAVLGTLPSDVRNVQYCYSTGSGVATCDATTDMFSQDVFFFQPSQAGSLTRVTNTPTEDELVYFID
jgi:hypothetical protein